jgi:hypothetical protein
MLLLSAIMFSLAISCDLHGCCGAFVQQAEEFLLGCHPSPFTISLLVEWYIVAGCAF